MQLLVPLDAGDLAEGATEAGQADAGDLAEPAQPPSVPASATKTKVNRTASKRVRDQQAYQRQLDRMGATELAGELKKWHNTEKKNGKAGWSTDRIKAVQREIEQRDLLGEPASDQADAPNSDDQADIALLDGGPQTPVGERTGVGLPPPPCSIGVGDGFGSRVAPQRLLWRSPVVRLEEYADPLPPYTPPPREHPIATLGTDPEAMRAAHEYCAAVLARAGGET